MSGVNAIALFHQMRSPFLPNPLKNWAFPQNKSADELSPKPKDVTLDKTMQLHYLGDRV
ncbi:hypothetical protein LAY57_26265 [Argonema antarcticum A004/B2]|nr:hypothetical protein [Argonema antarcticum A004/B2]